MSNITSQIACIVNDRSLQSLAQSYGVSIQSVSWEDCARSKGSCWGPNITDMTLSCNDRNMPTIRKPNFADVTCDQSIDKFTVTVGNETGSALKQVSLKEYLENIKLYTKNTNIESMYVERDSEVLVSAQACILPLVDGQVEFCVQMYNYQSNSDSTDPAVLVIMTSAQGSSCQVVYGQTKIYFNDNGVARNMLAKRLTDDRKERGVALEGALTDDEKNRNALFIYQIPLKQKKVEQSRGISYESLQTGGGKSFGYKGCMLEGCDGDEEGCDGDDGNFDESFGECERKSKKSVRSLRGFEKAVLSKGRDMGKFTGTNNLTLVRDTSYPIRCVYQSYNVTDTTTITEAQIKDIAESINNVYTKGVASGSLVLSTTDRKTEPKFETSTVGEKKLCAFM